MADNNSVWHKKMLAGFFAAASGAFLWSSTNPSALPVPEGRAATLQEAKRTNTDCSLAFAGVSGLLAMGMVLGMKKKQPDHDAPKPTQPS